TRPNVVTYNTLLKLPKTYEQGCGVIELMQAAEISPDLVTYNTLLNLAATYEQGCGVIELMNAAETRPNVVTYTTLLNLAATYKQGCGVIELMQAAEISPDLVTYNTLLKLPKTYEQDCGVIESMKAAGIPPNLVTYSTLFSKDLSGVTARELVGWYLEQQYCPAAPMSAAIANYRKKRLINESLCLCMYYPHLEAARKVIRKNREAALSYFLLMAENEADRPQATYALGVTYEELGRYREALAYMREAHSMADEGPRKMALEQVIKKLSKKLGTV
ncbi:MAG: hypothetical protein NTZ09_04770, partial [Candidatus Hydrogenedentes bacterium]|nr:hypothetical protein [Candidatus Hydrogenedentota bacterium]